MSLYHALLATPFVVLVVGTVLLLLPKRFCTRRIGLGLTAIGGALSLVTTAWLLTYPTSERQAAQERLLFSTNSSGIQSIALAPRYDDGAPAQYNLVDRTMTLTGAEQVRQVVQALHQARPFSPNHPFATWACMLTISSNDDDVCVEVVETKSKENGVVVYLWSHGHQGWLVANYRCDPLGPVLEKLVANQGAAVPK
jgi:hypothetical protein